MKDSRSTQCRNSALCLLSALLTVAAPAHAAPPGYPVDVYAGDPREMAMVPRYCTHTQVFRDRVPGGNNPAQIEHWSSVMGQTFHAMHHYCGGLIKTNRAVLLSRTSQERLFYLEDSIKEFDYVIQRAPQDFVLLPEILTKKGENLIRLGRSQLAITELQRAIDLKPDYWPPYVQLSDYYRGIGDLQRAREYLETALSYSPDAKGLKKRLMELDSADAKHKTVPR